MTYSLKYGMIDTDISKALDEIENKVEQLQTNRLMAWLILDYELTAQKTAASIGVPNKNVLSFSLKKDIVLKP